jgi:hypothetical protein
MIILIAADFCAAEEATIIGLDALLHRLGGGRSHNEGGIGKFRQMRRRRAPERKTAWHPRFGSHAARPAMTAFGFTASNAIASGPDRCLH